MLGERQDTPMKTVLNKILYVEDELDIQAIAQIALESVGGFTLKVCSNGNDAIKEILDFLPDLILLDVMMPGIDGPSTLSEIRKIPEFTHTPAIFMTAKVQPDEVNALREYGAVEVIAKPFDPMELANTIRKIWDSLD